ncbi:MAG: hypothetical protein AAGB00_07160 [Planctomycetota bacterium]
MRNRLRSTFPGFSLRHPRVQTAALAAAALVAFSAPRDAAGQASVSSNGDISPVEFPFLPGDQGLPTNGNTVITSGTDFFGNPVDFGGNRFDDEDGVQVGQFNYERSQNVEVGRLSPGQLFLTGGANLRFGDLIIGGDGGDGSGTGEFNANNIDVLNGPFGTAAAGDELTTAVGTVEIVGAGSLYNNHPLIVPTQFQQVIGTSDPESTSFEVPLSFNPTDTLSGPYTGIPDSELPAGFTDTIFSIARPGTVNSARADGEEGYFDLYVGLSGSGTLLIAEGGRAEIRDGVFAGVAPNAVGRITVDGSGSYLAAYGLKNPVSERSATPTAAPSATGAQQTLIGVYGEGTLEVTNGGRVDSFNRAALGAANADGDEAEAFNGGRGDAIVSGVGSVWRILSPRGITGDDDPGLAIGEFFNDINLDQRIDQILVDIDEPDGNEGRGKLTITDGGLVTVQEDDASAGSSDNDAGVRIGYQGELQLRGGRIAVGGRIDNDGFIRTGDNLGGVERYGDGEIETGTFLNSPVGLVQVRGSERLTIRSTAEEDDGQTATAGTSGGSTYFLGNAGKIQVLGDQAIGKAEFEAMRPTDLTPMTPGEDGRFKNFSFDGVAGGGGVDAMGMPVVGEVRGMITAQDANLYFRSGLLNQGDLLFVGGDSVVTGMIENEMTGLISLVNESHVTFQDNVQNDGQIVLNNDSNALFAGNLTGTGMLIDLNPATITVGGDLNTDGAFEFVIGGGDGGLDSTLLTVLGDATFGASSTLAIEALSLTGVVEGSAYDLFNISGAVTDAGLTVVSLPTAPAGLAFVPDTDLTDGVFTLSVVAATMVGAALGDVNADGVVNLQDVEVWEMFNGIESGAVAMLGDADGDGDVDPTDLFTITQQLGAVGPVVSLATLNAPEPTTGLLGLLAVAGCGLVRRRVS